MSEALEIGAHKGVIQSTRVTADAQDRETVELLVKIDERSSPVTVRLALYGGAEPISVQTINRLGYKGTLQQLADGNSSLNGMLVEVEAKESKAVDRNGKPYVNLSIRTPRAMPVSKVRDLKFGESSAEVPSGW